MKRIAIVSVADQRHMTMISVYTDLLDKNNVEYDIICIDRYGDGVGNYNKCRVYQYEFFDNGKSSKKEKAVQFVRFSRFCIKTIKRNKYDFLVIWNENTAALLALFLRYHYKGRYCVNIRDVDFMKNTILRMGCKMAIENSAFSTTPTPQMINYPPNYFYTLVLSSNNKILRECNPRNCLNTDDPIRISFIGKIRFDQANMFLIDALKNDSRFVLQFFGAGSEKYKPYIDNNDIRNVVLVGKYMPEETPKFLEKTDIIHAFYGTHYHNYKISAPIKFGYAPGLNIPALVTRDTYLDSVGSKYGFTFSIDETDDRFKLADSIYKWYRSLDFDDFKRGCQEYCTYVDTVNKSFEDTCIKYMGLD